MFLRRILGISGPAAFHKQQRGVGSRLCGSLCLRCHFVFDHVGLMWPFLIYCCCEAGISELLKSNSRMQAPPKPKQQLKWCLHFPVPFLLYIAALSCHAHLPFPSFCFLHPPYSKQAGWERPVSSFFLHSLPCSSDRA